MAALAALFIHSFHITVIPRLIAEVLRSVSVLTPILKVPMTQVAGTVNLTCPLKQGQLQQVGQILLHHNF